MEIFIFIIGISVGSIGWWMFSIKAEALSYVRMKGTLFGIEMAGKKIKQVMVECVEAGNEDEVEKIVDAVVKQQKKACKTGWLRAHNRVER